jgi:hypothetical protein
MNGSDWAAVFQLVTAVAGAAATGYANAQIAAQPQPNVFYTGAHIDERVGLLCHYSDGSERPYPTLADCPASFYLPPGQ